MKRSIETRDLFYVGQKRDSFMDKINCGWIMQGCKRRGVGDLFKSGGVKEGCLSEVAPVNDSVPNHRKLIHFGLETRL